MNSKILRRLEQLERTVPSDLIVEYIKDDETVRNTMKEFCKECRETGMICRFRVVDGTRMDDIDMLIALIDDCAKDAL